MPATWVVVADEPLEGLQPALKQALDPTKTYAVRSSANVEDSAVASYAGQFDTELDVPFAEVTDAVARVRASGTSKRVAAYTDHVGGAEDIAVNVMIQPMVKPVVSGVAFSRNPMTGLNETVVEAVVGRGDRLVDEGVTPQRWIHRWGGWVERPKDEVLAEHVVADVVASTVALAGIYGVPIDLEWVWDGEEIWWVQMRPITGLDDVTIYSNRISKEVMPGMIKPLVWSVNVPMVNQAWVNLFTEAIGPNEIKPETLARAFCYRSYFNMGAIGEIFELLGMPRDSLELLLGLPSGEDKPKFRPSAATMRLLPKMLRMGARKSRYGKILPAEVHALRHAYKKFDVADLSGRSDSSLLSDLRALSDIGVRSAYANIVTPLLANIYNGLLRKRVVAAGLDPESVAIGGTSELDKVNPNRHLDRMSETLATVDPATIERIRVEGITAMPEQLRSQFDRFIDQFGHLSVSGNDFSVAPWRETPQVVIWMILDHAATHGTVERRPWDDIESDLRPLSRRLLRSLRNRTQQFMEHRENVSFTYTYGYGLFRKYFLEIGRRLAKREMLSSDTDIMYLYLDEVRAALLGSAPETNYQDLVDARRDEMLELRDVVMPEIIYGDDFVPVRTSFAGAALEGIPTSRGHHRGPLRVVRDASDFNRVQAGDVIAIPYSDVGWTPLFARAGAVVAEAGGMLSHSSIVAREYRIPCVVSVPGATHLPDGATVVVDGYRGTVAVDESRSS